MKYIPKFQKPNGGLPILPTYQNFQQRTDNMQVQTPTKANTLAKKELIKKDLQKEIINYNPLVKLQPKSVAYPIAKDRRSTFEKVNNYAKRNTIGLRSWMDDVGAPALGIASLFSPAAPIGWSYLIDQAAQKGMPSEISNTGFNRFVKPQDYTSELAGGLYDFRQSYQQAKRGNWTWDKTGPGAIPNAIWGTSGIIEVPKYLKQVPIFRQIDQIDNITEWSKSVGDSMDLISTFIK